MTFSAAYKIIFILAIVLTMSIFRIGNVIAQENSAEESPPKELVESSSQSVKTTKIQLLNKITTRNSELNIAAGSGEKFGNLFIRIQDCWKAPPEEKPEVATLIKVEESKAGEDTKEIFYGWMFASSPAISALEHPVYDIVVLDCILSN